MKETPNDPTPPTDANVLGSTDSQLLSSIGSNNDQTSSTGISTGGESDAGLSAGGTDTDSDGHLVATDADTPVPRPITPALVYVNEEDSSLYGLTYFNDVPEGYKVAHEFNLSSTVSEVIEVARKYGFSPKSIINHLLAEGYQFHSEDEMNTFYSMDY